MAEHAERRGEAVVASAPHGAETIDLGGDGALVVAGDGHGRDDVVVEDDRAVVDLVVAIEQGVDRLFERGGAVPPAAELGAHRP